MPNKSFFISCIFSFCVSYFGANCQSTTFTYTGAVQFYTVPNGITQLQIEAYGAQGGGNFGGLGGKAIGTVPVTPGSVLSVYVGGKPNVQQSSGGFNGGGAVLTLPCGGGSDGWPGGGASDVRLSSSLNDRMIVAGGGGGQGYSNGIGGSGGGTTGGDGAASWITNTNGKGATQTFGGSGGIYSTGPNSPAPSGTFGQGGASSPLGTYCTGGGGGGGWYGGGGGYVSAGGGGSSYINYPGTINASSQSGLNTGNGYVVITVLCSGISTSVSSNSICLGESVLLTASSVNGGVVSWNNGVVNGVAFVPSSVGSVTYTATSSFSGDCPANVTVDVIQGPLVNAGPDITICGNSSLITLNATGNASTISWNNGIQNNVAFTPPIGTTTYIVSGTSANGICQSTDTVQVTSNPLPIVSAGSNIQTCSGSQLILNGTGNADNWIWTNNVLNGVPFTPNLGVTTYTLTGIFSATGCSTVDDVQVSVLLSPQTFAGNDLTICEQTSVSLTANGNADIYNWSNGITDGVSFVPPIGSTVYSVTGVSTSNGCTSTDTLVVLVNPTPIVNAGSDLSICNDGSLVTLTATGNANDYVWSNNVQNGIPFVPMVGTTSYSVLGTNSSTGCQNTDMLTVTVNPLPQVTLTPSDEINGNDGNIASLVTGGLAPYTFDWSNDGIGDQNDAPNLNGISGGIYSVFVSDANGCQVLATTTVNSFLSAQEIPVDIQVFPNPTNDYIHLYSDLVINQIRIIDALGKEVFFDATSPTLKVDFTSYLPGTYFLIVLTDFGSSTMKITRMP